MSSAPCVESIRKFIPPEEIWPPGPSWGFHWADLDLFKTLNWQVVGSECTESLHKFVKATQITQGTIFQWGIVDYFGVPKRSFDFVRRAYQPLLVSLKLRKRRYLPGETLNAPVWIVNDLYHTFGNCTLQVTVRAAEEKKLSSDTRPIQRIPPDSSAHYGDFTWKVRGRRGDAFHLDVTLTDSTGKALTETTYLLLIADKQQARRRCRTQAEKLLSEKAKFHPADYYRFFPKLKNPGGL